VGGAIIVGLGSTAAYAATPSVTVTPNINLINNQKVKVAGKNLTKNKSYFVVQCNPKVKTLPMAQAQTACDLKHVVTTKTTATGTLSATFAVHTGTIGTGKGAAPCDKTHPCLLTVSPGVAAGSATTTIKFK
jgi:hypothetical protein